MQIKVGQVANQEFQLALKTLSTISFPTFKENLAVAKLIKSVQPIVDAFNRAYAAILLKYASESSGGAHKIPAESVAQLRCEIEKLECELVELPDMKIKLPESVVICPRDIVALEPFLDI